MWAVEEHHTKGSWTALSQQERDQLIAVFHSKSIPGDNSDSVLLRLRNMVVKDIHPKAEVLELHREGMATTLKPSDLKAGVPAKMPWEWCAGMVFEDLGISFWSLTEPLVAPNRKFVRKLVIMARDDENDSWMQVDSYPLHGPWNQLARMILERFQDTIHKRLTEVRKQIQGRLDKLVQAEQLAAQMDQDTAFVIARMISEWKQAGGDSFTGYEDEIPSEIRDLLGGHSGLADDKYFADDLSRFYYSYDTIPDVPSAHELEPILRKLSLMLKSTSDHEEEMYACYAIWIYGRWFREKIGSLAVFFTKGDKPVNTAIMIEALNAIKDVYVANPPKKDDAVPDLSAVINAACSAHCSPYVLGAYGASEMVRMGVAALAVLRSEHFEELMTRINVDQYLKGLRKECVRELNEILETWEENKVDLPEMKKRIERHVSR